MSAPDASARRRKQVLLRLDPAVHEALARWAGDELRSANAQIEFLLRQAPADAGRLPEDPGPLPRRGRPPGGLRPPALPGVTGPGRAGPQPVGSPAFPASAHASPGIRYEIANSGGRGPSRSSAGLTPAPP